MHILFCWQDTLLYKKRFGYAPKPLLLLYHVGSSISITIKLFFHFYDFKMFRVSIDFVTDRRRRAAPAVAGAARRASSAVQVNSTRRHLVRAREGGREGAREADRQRDRERNDALRPATTPRAPAQWRVHSVPDLVSTGAGLPADACGARPALRTEAALYEQGGQPGCRLA